MGKGTVLAIWVVGDTGALGVITATLLGFLPPMAAMFAIGWYILQMWESKTVQGLLRTHRLMRLVRLRARSTALELLIRQKNTALDGLVDANSIHAAAFDAARALTQKANIADHAIANAEKVQIQKDADFAQFKKDHSKS
jgi:hypothetical protein